MTSRRRTLAAEETGGNPMQSSILTPAAALVVWSLIIMLWMVVSRFSAFGAAKIDISKAPAGGRGQDLAGKIPADAVLRDGVHPGDVGRDTPRRHAGVGLRADPRRPLSLAVDGQPHPGAFGAVL